MALNIGGFNLGINLPTFSTAGIGYWITVIACSLLLLILGGIGIWIWYMNRIYNKEIIIFENIAGQGYQPVGKDKARIIKIGDGGEELLFLRKRKVYRTAYGRKMGKNTYWFAVGQDGYWYNILLGDLDAKMGILDIEPIDRDMRYMHVAIRKNIQERYKKESFMQKYGAFVMSSIFLLIMIIAIWLLISKVGDLIQQSAMTLKETNSLIPVTKEVISKLDAICSGSGITGA